MIHASLLGCKVKTRSPTFSVGDVKATCTQTHTQLVEDKSEVANESENESRVPDGVMMMIW